MPEKIRWERDRLNLPNLLTSLRFVLIPVYIGIFASGHMIPAFLVVVAAGVTDVLDGHIARRYGQITPAGEMLDPLADKLMLITVIVSLLVSGYISWWAAGAMFLRDLGMIAGGLVAHFRKKKNVPANWMGKLTTAMFYAAIMFIFFEAPFADTYLWIVIAFSFLTSFVYMASYRTLNTPQPKTPSA
ncbi:CDP-alcohol phosphatidyltransferase family protein [Paenibacillus sp. LHD-117]|uniref:CDP-alcohol phosphatidyltransferase family protein n=1 Tax=Paenibacillus sp. LHD-117 TaxID=3071412 RepID=UPI0027E078D8|nr:CDP-alcohol phosphatidyltransferase family protein [Paenibacillus sp. LHD-117]MDQ6420924.1 CDP-alcohol phosphatidyltransferase family protein [Paenibacillus sp. LHD-117]